MESEQTTLCTKFKKGNCQRRTSCNHWHVSDCENSDFQQDSSSEANVLTSTSRNLLMRRKLQQVLHSTSQQMMTDRCNYGKVSRSTTPNIERDFIISRTSVFSKRSQSLQNSRKDPSRRYRCGLILRDVASVKDTSSFALGRTRYHDKMGVDGDRKVSKESMVQCGKIHARGDVMSDIASSLTWDGDCNTNFMTPPFQSKGEHVDLLPDGMVDLVFDPKHICSCFYF